MHTITCYYVCILLTFVFTAETKSSRFNAHVSSTSGALKYKQIVCWLNLNDKYFKYVYIPRRSSASAFETRPFLNNISLIVPTLHCCKTLTNNTPKLETNYPSPWETGAAKKTLERDFASHWRTAVRFARSNYFMQQDDTCYILFILM